MHGIDFSLGLKNVITTLSHDEHSHGKDDDSEQQKEEDDPLQKAVGTKVIRHCLESLTRNIDRLIREEKEFEKDYWVKLVQDDMRQQEIKKMMDLLKEVDFAEGEQVAGSFNYREKDKIKNIRESVDVANDFFDGKYDPKKLELR